MSVTSSTGRTQSISDGTQDIYPIGFDIESVDSSFVPGSDVIFKVYLYDGEYEIEQTLGLDYVVEEGNEFIRFVEGAPAEGTLITMQLEPDLIQQTEIDRKIPPKTLEASYDFLVRQIISLKTQLDRVPKLINSFITEQTSSNKLDPTDKDGYRVAWSDALKDFFLAPPSSGEAGLPPVTAEGQIYEADEALLMKAVLPVLLRPSLPDDIGKGVAVQINGKLEYVAISGGNTPNPTEEGQLLKSDEFFNWILAKALLNDPSLPDDIGKGLIVLPDGSIGFITISEGNTPNPTEEGQQLESNAALEWIAVDPIIERPLEIDEGKTPHATDVGTTEWLHPLKLETPANSNNLTEVVDDNTIAASSASIDSNTGVLTVSGTDPEIVLNDGQYSRGFKIFGDDLSLGINSINPTIGDRYVVAGIIGGRIILQNEKIELPALLQSSGVRSGLNVESVSGLELVVRAGTGVLNFPSQGIHRSFELANDQPVYLPSNPVGEFYYALRLKEGAIDLSIEVELLTFPPTILDEDRVNYCYLAIVRSLDDVVDYIWSEQTNLNQIFNRLDASFALYTTNVSIVPEESATTIVRTGGILRGAYLKFVPVSNAKFNTNAYVVPALDPVPLNFRDVDSGNVSQPLTNFEFPPKWYDTGTNILDDIAGGNWGIYLVLLNKARQILMVYPITEIPSGVHPTEEEHIEERGKMFVYTNVDPRTKDSAILGTLAIKGGAIDFDANDYEFIPFLSGGESTVIPGGDLPPATDFPPGYVAITKNDAPADNIWHATRQTLYIDQDVSPDWQFTITDAMSALAIGNTLRVDNIDGGTKQVRLSAQPRYTATTGQFLTAAGDSNITGASGILAPSPTGTDVDKYLQATGVGQTGWRDVDGGGGIVDIDARWWNRRFLDFIGKIRLTRSLIEKFNQGGRIYSTSSRRELLPLNGQVISEYKYRGIGDLTDLVTASGGDPLQAEVSRPSFSGALTGIWNIALTYDSSGTSTIYAAEFSNTHDLFYIGIYDPVLDRVVRGSVTLSVGSYSRPGFAVASAKNAGAVFGNIPYRINIFDLQTGNITFTREFTLTVGSHTVYTNVAFVAATGSFYAVDRISSELVIVKMTPQGLPGTVDVTLINTGLAYTYTSSHIGAVQIIKFNTEGRTDLIFASTSSNSTTTSLCRLNTVTDEVLVLHPTSTIGYIPVTNGAFLRESTRDVVFVRPGAASLQEVAISIDDGSQSNVSSIQSKTGIGPIVVCNHPVFNNVVASLFTPTFRRNFMSVDSGNTWTALPDSNTTTVAILLTATAAHTFFFNLLTLDLQAGNYITPASASNTPIYVHTIPASEQTINIPSTITPNGSFITMNRSAFYKAATIGGDDITPTVFVDSGGEITPIVIPPEAGNPLKLEAEATTDNVWGVTEIGIIRSVSGINFDIISSVAEGTTAKSFAVMDSLNVVEGAYNTFLGLRELRRVTLLGASTPLIEIASEGQSYNSIAISQNIIAASIDAENLILFGNRTGTDFADLAEVPVTKEAKKVTSYGQFTYALSSDGLTINRYVSLGLSETLVRDFAGVSAIEEIEISVDGSRLYAVGFHATGNIGTVHVATDPSGTPDWIDYEVDGTIAEGFLSVSSSKENPLEVVFGNVNGIFVTEDGLATIPERLVYAEGTPHPQNVNNITLSTLRDITRINFIEDTTGYAYVSLTADGRSFTDIFEALYAPNYSMSRVVSVSSNGVYGHSHLDPPRTAGIFWDSRAAAVEGSPNAFYGQRQNFSTNFSQDLLFIADEQGQISVSGDLGVTTFILTNGSPNERAGGGFVGRLTGNHQIYGGDNGDYYTSNDDWETSIAYTSEFPLNTSITVLHGFRFDRAYGIAENPTGSTVFYLDVDTIFSSPTEIGEFLGESIVDVAVRDANELWIGTVEGVVYHTTDGGETWLEDSTLGRSDDEIISLQVDNIRNLIFLVNKKEIYFKPLENLLVEWEPVDFGLSGAGIKGFFLNHDSKLEIASTVGGSIYMRFNDF